MRFEGKGCAISTASASLMTEAVKGKERSRRWPELFEQVHALLTRQDAPADAALGKLAALSGVREFPARVKCASLCWHTLECRARARRAPPCRRSSEPMRTHENEPFVVNREVRAVIVPAGSRGEAQARPGGLHHPGARRQLHRLPRGQPVPHRRRGRRRHRQGSGQAARAAAQCDRRGRPQARLGPDAHLLRSGDPDQHRGPRARL